MRSIKFLIVCTILFCVNLATGQTITVTDNKGISLQMDIDDISYAVKNTAGQSVIIPVDKNVSYIYTSSLQSIQTLGCNKFYLFKVGKKNGSFALNDSVLTSIKFSQVQQTTTSKAVVKSIINGFSLITVELYAIIMNQGNFNCEDLKNETLITDSQSSLKDIPLPVSQKIAYVKSDSSFYNLRGNKWYRQSPIYSISEPLSVDGNINNTEAIWKNPNIVSNKTVDFTFQNYQWKPIKNHLTAFDFGAKGDSITDDAQALRNLIAYYAGKTCYIDNPPKAYLIGSSLGVIPDSTKIIGESKAQTKITRAYNGGYMLTLGDNTGLDNLHLDGNAAGYTGGGISIVGTAGNQSIEHCKIINFTGGTPLYYDATAGSRSVLQHCEIFRIDGTAGNNFFAIEIQDLLVANGAPRVFDDIQTGGYNTINTGGCSNLFVSNSPVFHSYFSENSRNVCFSNVRFSAAVSQTLRGTGSMIGSSVGSPIVIAPGAAWNLGPSFFNNTVIDSTTVPSANLIFSRELISFTPEFRNAGVPITLGSGSVLGQYQRVGNLMFFTVRLITNLGTTTMGAGQLQFTLPKVANASISFQVNISGRITQASSIWRVNGTISSNSNVVNLERDTSGAVTSTSPANISTNAIVLQVSGYILL